MGSDVFGLEAEKRHFSPNKNCHLDRIIEQ
jgi:hypothetical protein